MGLFDKLKNVFMEDDFDEEETSEIKLPEKKVKIEEYEEPKKEEKPVIKQIEAEEKPKVDPISDRDLFDTKDNFKFPIVFGDDDFEEEKKKTKSVNVLEKPKPIYEPEKKDTKPQKFKPSPVISPVYGILDKNYTKDDISVKDGLVTDINGKLDIDSVIKKAYGDDDKKVIITRKEKNKIDNTNEEPKIEKEITQTIKVVPKEEPTEEVSEKEKEEIDEKIKSIDALMDGEIEAEEPKFTVEELDEKIKSIDDMLNETTDEDFYSLVDSMYQEEE